MANVKEKTGWSMRDLLIVLQDKPRGELCQLLNLYNVPPPTPYDKHQCHQLHQSTDDCMHVTENYRLQDLTSKVCL